MLAGGTDILVQLREGMRAASVVVDVKKIPELTQIDFDGDGNLSLGAAAPCYQIYGNDRIDNGWTALTDATRIIGGWQIQSRASVGGNLCNSSPAADSIPALIAHRTAVTIAGPDGTREVAADQFCTGPGKNVLNAGELVTSLTLPAAAGKSGSAYERFIPRNEMDIAVVGAASWVKLNETGETIEDARIALGAVAPTPKFADEASTWLAGQPCSDATYRDAGEKAKAVASPISDMRGTAEYRTHLVGVLVARTLARAVERARKGASS